MVNKLNNQFFGSILLFITKYLNVIIAPLVSLLVIRYLGADLYGYYATVTSIIVIVSMLPDFGVQQSILHLSVEKKYNFFNIISRSLRLSFIFSVIGYIFVVSWFWFLDYNFSIKIIGILMGLTFFRESINTVVTAALQVHGEYGRIAFWSIISSSSQWIGTLIAILFKANIYELVFLPILMSYLIIITMFLIELKKLNFVKHERSEKNISYREILKSCWKFGVTGSMHQLYHYSDGAILSTIRQPIEVGYYNIAFRLLNLIYVLPGIIFNQILFPKYFRWSKKDPDKLKLYYFLMNKLMVILGINIFCGIFLFSNELITFVFGSEYGPASKLLIVMSFAIPIRFLGSSIGGILTSTDLLSWKLKIQILLAFFNIIMNVLFIPLYGAMSAAIIMVCTDSLLLILYTIILHKMKYKFNSILKGKATFIIMVFILFCISILIFFSQLTLLLKAFGMILIIMGSIIFGFKVLTKREVFEVLNLIKRT